MKEEKPVTDEKLKDMIHEAKVEAVEQWLQQHMWYCWSSTNADKKHKAFIYGYADYDTEHKYRKIIDYDFSKVHGKDRKILKFAFKKIEKAYKEQWGLWNKFAGKDVLYVHTRTGGLNRHYYHTADLQKHKRYLGDCDDAWDETYCDLYFDIADIDTSNIKEGEDV